MSQKKWCNDTINNIFERKYILLYWLRFYLTLIAAHSILRISFLLFIKY